MLIGHGSVIRDFHQPTPPLTFNPKLTFATDPADAFLAHRLPSPGPGAGFCAPGFIRSLVPPVTLTEPG
jgi:hypothetical protein